MKEVYKIHIAYPHCLHKNVDIQCNPVALCFSIHRKGFISQIHIPLVDSCLLVFQISLVACLSFTHTVTWQLSLLVTTAPSLSLHYPAGADWYLNKVKLKITDVNDNVPEWNMKPYPYLAVVSPEAPTGTFVYQLQAHDGDEGKRGEVEYFLSDGKLFTVHIHAHKHNMYRSK